MKGKDRRTKDITITKSFCLSSSFVISVFLFFYSCTQISNVPVSGSGQCIDDVPYYPQETYQCGPAALAGVLNYWGVPVIPQDIAEEIFSKSARGTLNSDMVLYARKKGLKALAYRGSIEDVKEKISHGYPIIVLVDLGFSFYQANHFIVLTGFNEHGVVVNSKQNKRRYLSWKDFYNAWEKTHFWTLFITPS